MTKYIKTDAIVDKVCEGISCNECSFGTNEDGMSECVLQKRIDGLPTADVVEVVRCKDCKHYSDRRCQMIMGIDDRKKDNDYCSYGERREDD